MTTSLIIVLAIVATIGLLASVLCATIINKLFPAKANAQTVQVVPAVVAVQPKTLPQIDTTIVKALVRKGFRVEQINDLVRTGRLQII